MLSIPLAVMASELMPQLQNLLTDDSLFNQARISPWRGGSVLTLSVTLRSGKVPTGVYVFNGD